MVSCLALSISACSERQKRTWEYRSPDENYRTALDAEHADQRRDAVARIAESSYYASDEAFAVLETAARTDPQAQIRCIAIRALARYRDNRPVKPLLTILQAGENSPDALPANDDIRWETVNALIQLTRGGYIDGPGRELVRDALIRLADMERNRSVRLAALAGLGEFKDRQVLAPLIRALRSDDFAIADRAEQSLIALTGMTHDYDPGAWEAWVAATPDPFARAGQRPTTTRPAGSSWWERQQRAWRRGLRLGPD